MTEKEIISLVQKTLRELLNEALKPLYDKQKRLEELMGLFYDSLETMEKVATRLGMTQDEVQFMREKMDRHMKDLKADVKDVKANVEEQISEQTTGAKEAVAAVKEEAKSAIAEVKNVLIENN